MDRANVSRSRRTPTRRRWQLSPAGEIPSHFQCYVSRARRECQQQLHQTAVILPGASGQASAQLDQQHVHVADAVTAGYIRWHNRTPCNHTQH